MSKREECINFFRRKIVTPIIIEANETLNKFLKSREGFF